MTRDSKVLIGVVDEVTARAIGAAALEVELVAEFSLVLGVAIGLAQLTQAMGKLALRPVAAAPTLGEGSTELSLVARRGGGGCSR